MTLRYYVILFLLTTTALSSCVNYRKQFNKNDYPDQYLLHKQKLKGNKEFSSITLNELIPDQPNRSFISSAFGKPYLGIYIMGKKKKIFGFIPGYNPEKLEAKYKKTEAKYDKKIAKDSTNLKRASRLNKKKKKKLDKIEVKIKEGNGLMRTVGEKPVLIDSLDIGYVERQLELYYQSKGFFQVEVKSEIISLKKNSVKTKVIFHINEGKAHKFGATEYEIEDPVLEEIILKSKNSSYVKKGENFDASKLGNERIRITRLLKNEGYYKITRQSISFEVDTLENPYTAHVKIIVENPQDGSRHERYRVRNVVFRVDAGRSPNPDTVYYEDGTKFVIGTKKVSTKLLKSKIRINPGDYYSYAKSEKSQVLLGGINSFKFVNINYIDIGDNLLTAVINTSSSKKYAITTEGGNECQCKSRSRTSWTLRFYLVSRQKTI